MIDVETTGLSPRSDRVIEVGVVLLDRHGKFEHEWVSRLNPQRPVGATHIHGITDADVAQAPVFEAVVPHLAGLLHGRALVAHNARFDSSFMKFEFGRANWSWPSVPMLCTLDASWHYLPHLDRRRLSDCCWAAGLKVDGGHSALVDARATANLLAHYLHPGVPPTALQEHRAVVGQATRVLWPTGAGMGRIADPSAPAKLMPRTIPRYMYPQARRRCQCPPLPCRRTSRPGRPSGASHQRRWDMRDMIWLVREGQALVGAFAMRTDAERRAAEARAEQGRDGEPEGWAVRVEPWTITPPSGLPPFEEAGRQHEAILEQMDREWGLLEIAPMGTAHFFHLDTYLLVPYRNRLVVPAFQFDQWRQLWPGFRDVLKVFRDSGWDEFSITAWFVSHQGSADGDVPALLIRDEPERVLDAARISAADR
ncbi:3'-5' exonuclease [Knoellia aerolata]|nr:3'-5' exonuclease [Knoellia aerolata]